MRVMGPAFVPAFVLAIFLAIAAGQGVRADTPGADWIPPDTIIAKLKSLDYTDIGEIEADDGHWTVDARKGDVTYDISIDPHTGVITKIEPEDD